MRILTPLLALVLTLSAAVPALAQSKVQDYKDASGAYILQVPAGWKTQREAMDNGGSFTSFGTADKNAAKVYVLHMPAAQDLKPEQLQDVATTLISAGLTAIQEDGQLMSKKESKVTFAGREAVRCDIAVKDAQGTLYKGYLIAVLGKRNAYLLAAEAPADDAVGLKQTDAVLATLGIEGVRANGSGGMFSAAALARTAAAANLVKADADGTILYAGDTPLTVGSVRNFTKAIEICFDIRLTDAEFEMTKDRFIQYYIKADAQGQAILAQGGAKILEELTRGTPQEQAAAREINRKVMLERFTAGAKAGIDWAAALYESIQRRTEKVAVAQGAVPKVMAQAQVKTELTAADLDASVEMLYFMWVASGRDAALVTPDAVVSVRTVIATGFAQLPGDLQYLFANAEKIYPQMRAAYLQATPQDKIALAQQFAVALDAMGLTVPRPQAAVTGGTARRKKSAWDDVNPDDARYGLMVNTCWNLAQKATR